MNTTDRKYKGLSLVDFEEKIKALKYSEDPHLRCRLGYSFSLRQEKKWHFPFYIDASVFTWALISFSLRHVHQSTTENKRHIRRYI